MKNAFRDKILRYLYAVTYCCPETPACDRLLLEKIVMICFYCMCRLICLSRGFSLRFFYDVMFTIKIKTPVMVFHREDNFAMERKVLSFEIFNVFFSLRGLDCCSLLIPR